MLCKIKLCYILFVYIVGYKSFSHNHFQFFTEGFSCVPTKFDPALVETPNKLDVIQTVSACELKESCYRVPYVEFYYEIVLHADGVKEERLKVSAEPSSPTKCCYSALCFKSAFQNKI